MKKATRAETLIADNAQIVFFTKKDTQAMFSRTELKYLLVVNIALLHLFASILSVYKENN
jgi:hypothetical protein